MDNKIICCIIAFILGMLLYNVLKDTCKCGLIEGSQEGTTKSNNLTMSEIIDLKNQLSDKDQQISNLINKMNELDNKNKLKNAQPGSRKIGCDENRNLVLL